MRTSLLLLAIGFGLGPAAAATPPPGWVTTRSLLLGAGPDAYETLQYEARGFGDYRHTRHRLHLVRRAYDGTVLTRVILGGHDAHRLDDEARWSRAPVPVDTARVERFYEPIRLRDASQRLAPFELGGPAEERFEIRADSGGLRLVVRDREAREADGPRIAEARELNRHLSIERSTREPRGRRPLQFEDLGPHFVRSRVVRQSRTHAFLEVFFDLHGWTCQAVLPVPLERVAGAFRALAASAAPPGDRAPE